MFVFLIWGVDKAITYSRQRQPAFRTVEVSTPRMIAPIPDWCASKHWDHHRIKCLAGGIARAQSVHSPLFIGSCHCWCDTDITD